MSTPILKISNELKIFCDAHDQIKTFADGEFLDIIKDDTIDYVLAHLNIRRGAISELSNTYSLEISVMDKTFDDDRNLRYVKSNMYQVWDDIYQVVKNSPRWNDIGLVQSNTSPEFFKGQGADVVAGWGGVIEIEVYKNSGYCDLPVTGYDYEGPEEVPSDVCLPAYYQNSDLSFTQEIASGTTFTAPDITLTQSNGDTSQVPANKDIVCASFPAPDATYQNSNGSFIQAIASGGTFTSTDIDFTDSDGTTTQVPTNENIVCTPESKDINLKGVFDADVEDMPQLVIDSDSAGTYTSIADDGASGSITISVNGGAYSAFSSPLVLVSTDTLDVKRTVFTALGFYKLTGTY